MRTLFISDLHLENSRPEMTKIFIQFLQREVCQSEALYILGDLFESYIGDDEDNALHQQVTNALLAVKKKGVPVYLMHGNRDFLIGKSFAKKSGVTLINDPSIIEIYDKKILLMHGDTLCTKDIKYLSFRKKARNIFLQKLFLASSLKRRQAMAEKARMISQKHTMTTAPEIMDVTPEEIPKIMRSHRVLQLIHGHTHRPGFHWIWNQQTVLVRTTLGDWENSGHFLAYYSDGSSRLASV